MAGVTNPAKTLILTRWGQRVGEKPSEDLIGGKEERGGGLFGAYDQMLEVEIKELLIADMRERIDRKSLFFVDFLAGVIPVLLPVGSLAWISPLLLLILRLHRYS